MTDPLAALRPWVRSEHLASVDASSGQHEGQACRSVDGFLVARLAEDLADFLTNGAIMERSYRLYSDLDPVPPDRWMAARDTDRFANVTTVVGMGDDPLSAGAVSYVRLLQMLRSGAFRAFLERISRTDLEPIHELTTWCMTADDFVRPHRYDPASCGIRVSLCLSMGRDPELGGAWCVLDGQERLTRVPFRQNALLVMDASAGATYWAGPIRDTVRGIARFTVSACFARAR